jgi:hypothetical protein
MLEQEKIRKTPGPADHTVMNELEPLPRDIAGRGHTLALVVRATATGSEFA